jgi:regulatory protein
MNKEKNKCLEYFLKILSQRDYSVYQLLTKGKQKGFIESEINSSIEILKENNYVNDLRLSQNIVNFYDKQRGVNWIKVKLLQKGISKETIQEVTFNIENQPDNIIKRKIEKKLQIVNWKDIDQKQKMKCVSQLIYLGFPNAISIINDWQNEE